MAQVWAQRGRSSGHTAPKWLRKQEDNKRQTFSEMSQAVKVCKDKKGNLICKYWKVFCTMKCDTTKIKSHRMGKIHVEGIFNKSSLSKIYKLLQIHNQYLDSTWLIEEEMDSLRQEETQIGYSRKHEKSLRSNLITLNSFTCILKETNK